MSNKRTVKITPNERKAYQAQWYAEHREEQSRYHAARYANNPEPKRQQAKNWYHNNYERALKNAQGSTARRRQRLKANGGHYSKRDIEDMLQAQEKRCNLCLTSLQAGYEIDHVLPVVLGGSSWPSNLQLLCVKCSRSKGYKHPDEI